MNLKLPLKMLSDQQKHISQITFHHVKYFTEQTFVWYELCPDNFHNKMKRWKQIARCTCLLAMEQNTLFKAAFHI